MIAWKTLISFHDRSRILTLDRKRILDRQTLPFSESSIQNLPPFSAMIESSAKAVESRSTYSLLFPGILCPPIVPGNYVEMSSQERTFGSRVSFSCPGGQRIVGAESITCLRNETWSDMPPNCEGMRKPVLRALHSLPDCKSSPARSMISVSLCYPYLSTSPEISRRALNSVVPSFNAFSDRSRKCWT